MDGVSGSVTEDPGTAQDEATEGSADKAKTMPELPQGRVFIPWGEAHGLEGVIHP